jgi:hypothetical protein
MRRIFLALVVLSAIGVAFYFVGLWYDYGPSGRLFLGGYRWLATCISCAMFYPGMMLTRLGISFKLDAQPYRAMISAAWTVSTSAMVYGGWRLLTWWKGVRQPRIHRPRA